MFDVSDPATMTGVVVLMSAVARFLPACRAARVDPPGTGRCPLAA